MTCDGLELAPGPHLWLELYLSEDGSCTARIQEHAKTTQREAKPHDDADPGMRGSWVLTGHELVVTVPPLASAGTGLRLISEDNNETIMSFELAHGDLLAEGHTHAGEPCRWRLKRVRRPTGPLD